MYSAKNLGYRGYFMKKNETWCKRRHEVVTTLLRPIFRLFIFLKYGIRIEKFKEQGDRAYLILMNHQTPLDQFFVSLTFRRPVYFLATEDIFSMGILSDLLRYLVAPIPIQKGNMDLRAVKTCIRVAREGGTICLAPEGNRTYHGRTLHMRASIVSLIRSLKLPVAIFRIEGGYGVEPRWSDVARRGKMRSFVKCVIEPEQYAEMTNDELLDLIRTELSVDEARVSGEYVHPQNAQYLERMVYTCPHCGFSPFESHGDIVECTRCHLQVRHLPTRELQGVNEPFMHRFVADWYDWQNGFVNGTDLLALTQKPVFEDTVRVSLVHAHRRKEVLKKAAAVALYGDRITIDGEEYSFERISGLSVLGRNKLSFYDGEHYLQMKGSKRFNALKYVNFYYRYKNLTTGEANGEFLGL